MKKDTTLLSDNAKQLAVRRRFLFALLSVVMSIYGAVDYFNLADECLTMYILELVVSLSCGVLYAWWWNRIYRETRMYKSAKPASDVFKWLTVLFFGQAIRLVGNIVVRTEYLSNLASLPEQCGFVKGSYPWTFRNFPELLVLIFMLALILARLWCNNPIHRCQHGD